jgi:hypothetical protein
VAALGLLAWEVFWLWKRGPWDLPNPPQVKPQAVVEKADAGTGVQRPVGTEVIISKNLFDPERGAGFTRESEANSRAFQRVRAMILLGTAIIGNTRQALLQDGETAQVAAGSPGQSGGPMRVKLGDMVEGFKLSEVGDKRVVFSRGSSRVEIALDYFRKVEPTRPVAAAPAPRGQIRQPSPVAPRVIPALPRRQPPPSPNADANS